MTGKRKTTASVSSVGADGKQPNIKKDTEIIANETAQINLQATNNCKSPEKSGCSLQTVSMTGSKRGLETRVSLKKALEALGFKGGTRSETERNQWYAHEKKQLSELMLDHGIEWEKKGTHEKHLSVLDFKKQERSKEVEELEKKKTELQSENQSYEEINENLKGQLSELDDEIRSMQNGMEKSKKEAESARKQADKYQKRMQELAPMVKDMEHMAAKFSDNPEQVLPEAGSIESGKSYREKKAKPLMEKIVKVLRSVYASYLDVSRKFDKLQLSYNRTVEKANNLSDRFHEIYTVKVSQSVGL